MRFVTSNSSPLPDNASAAPPSWAATEPCSLCSGVRVSSRWRCILHTARSGELWRCRLTLQAHAVRQACQHLRRLRSDPRASRVVMSLLSLGEPSKSR